MEPELSGIFLVKIAPKNIVLGSPRTHFMHVRIKEFCLKIDLCFCGIGNECGYFRFL